MEHVMEVPNPNEHLMERILSTEKVIAAWKRVKANKGKPGFDRITIEDFPDHFRPLWPGIREVLLTGGYELSAVLRTEISQSLRRYTSAGDSHRTGSGDSAGHCPGNWADLRSVVFGT